MLLLCRGGTNENLGPNQGAVPPAASAAVRPYRAASQAVTAGVCFSRRATQLVICSSVWVSVRAAPGSGWAAKNAATSSRAGASQNEPSARTRLLSPPKTATFGASAGQLSLTKDQARGRAALLVRNCAR